MAVNVDWRLASAPNVLGAYMGAREKAQQNVLAQQQAQEQSAQRQRENARADERWAVEKPTLEAQAGDAQRQAQMKRVTTSYQAVRGIQSPEQLEAARGTLAQVDPDFAHATWEDIQQLQQVGGALAKKLELVKGDDGSYSVLDESQDFKRVGGYQPAVAPKMEQFDPQKDLYQVPGRAAVTEGVAGAPQQPQQGAPTGGGFDSVIAPLMGREGGYVAHDGVSGAPANYGINQRANPDINVARLTPDQAKQIYKERYWDKIGGDQLPPQAQAAVFDAAVNQGPDTATQMWQQSGGDLGKFNQLRQDRYRQTPGYDQYGKSWDARVAETGGGAQPAAAPAAPAAPGAPQLVRGAQPKPMGHMATPEEKTALGVQPDIPVWVGEDGKPQVISGTAAQLKKIPPAIQGGYISNQTSISQIDAAIAAIKANPKALGLLNKLGDDVNQRLDPAGVDTRAAVANIGSQLIHDRSGAAVTAAEQPRLMPFVPQVTDTPEAAVRKLQGMKRQYESNNTEIEVAYGDDNGYNPIKGGAKPAAEARRPDGFSRQLTPQQRATAGRFKGATAKAGDFANPYAPTNEAEYNKLPSGAHYIHTGGQIKVKP